MDFKFTDGELNDGANTDVVDGLSLTAGVSLPSDYLDFLRRHNGGEGFIGEEYAILWRAEEIAEFNRQYEVKKYAPDIFLFGSSGGGEAYGFDTRSRSTPVVRVPFVGMSRQHTLHVADKFPDLFLEHAVSRPAAHSVISRTQGSELIEIMPVILGGDPINPKNRAWLTREQHFESVRYWNKVLSDLQGEEALTP